MEYRRQIEAYREEFLSCGDSLDGTGVLRRFERAADWLEHTNAYKHAETVPHGRVPATQYIFMREEDRKIVGMIQIRHFLNDYLEQFVGHIGYSAAPSERRNGYAAEMLRLTLLDSHRLDGSLWKPQSIFPYSEGYVKVQNGYTTHNGRRQRYDDRA